MDKAKVINAIKASFAFLREAGYAEQEFSAEGAEAGVSYTNADGSLKISVCFDLREHTVDVGVIADGAYTPLSQLLHRSSDKFSGEDLSLLPAKADKKSPGAVMQQAAAVTAKYFDMPAPEQPASEAADLPKAKMWLGVLAVFDGVIRALALFLLVLYTSSERFDGSWASVLAAAAISALVLSVLLAALTFVKLRDNFNCGIYALISGCVFVVLSVVAFMQLDLLPLSELYSADGLLIIFEYAAFLALNLVGRLATFCTVWLKRRGYV